MIKYRRSRITATDTIQTVVLFFLIMLFVFFSLIFSTVVDAAAAQVTLQWDANSPAPDGYRIFQRLEGESYDYMKPVCETKDTICTVQGLAPATHYYFVARAFVKEDESADSNEVDFKPEVPAPVHLRINLEISVYIDVNGQPIIQAAAPAISTKK